MFKCYKDKAKMATLSLLGLSMLASPYVSISAPSLKQTNKKKQHHHFPYPQKEYKPYFQDKLSLDISYVTLCF